MSVDFIVYYDTIGRSAVGSFQVNSSSGGSLATWSIHAKGIGTAAARKRIGVPCSLGSGSPLEDNLRKFLTL